jgi:DMSO/TMAO reductase YedYZ molybdopterin-dependent catalytic subunit
MANEHGRREILKGGLAAAGLSVLGIPEWALPAMAQGEELVAFTDIPENFNTNPVPTRRILDLRAIDGRFTPRDQFFTTQHHDFPTIDPASFRLKVTGLVEREMNLSLDDIRGMGPSDLDAGFECSGNSARPIEGLAGNARWTGVALSTVLNKAGVKPEGREIVFFGTDHGEEEVEFRGRKFTVDQQYGRSMSKDHALSGEPFLAYEMNGEPLTVNQGFPLRLIVPGWYGAPNVKWLAQIHVQSEPFLGKYQARWYRTLRGEMIDGEMKWKETAITRMNLKSVIARVTREGNQVKILGFVLNDGTPLRSVEVSVDDGPWQPATMDPTTSGKFEWKLFTYLWKDPSPGEHTIVSRATDVHGTVQPTAADLENKLTFLENNAQFPRTIKLS